MRADSHPDPGQITTQVVEHVLSAKAAVADLTEDNPNVFYEVAVRHAFRLPVVLIAEQEDKQLPFDIAQMRRRERRRDGSGFLAGSVSGLHGDCGHDDVVAVEA